MNKTTAAPIKYTQSQMIRIIRMQLHNIHVPGLAKQFKVSQKKIVEALYDNQYSPIVFDVQNYIDKLPIHIPSIPKESILRKFDNINISFIDKENALWITAEQLGIALGYSEPRKGIMKIYERYKDILEGFTGVVNLTTPGGRQDVTVFNEVGANIIALKSNTKTAKKFVIWAAKLISDYRHGNLNMKKELMEQKKLLNTLLELSCEAINEPVNPDIFRIFVELSIKLKPLDEYNF